MNKREEIVNLLKTHPNTWYSTIAIKNALGFPNNNQLSKLLTTAMKWDDNIKKKFDYEDVEVVYTVNGKKHHQHCYGCAFYMYEVKDDI